jgi:hypothetical protein
VTRKELPPEAARQALRNTELYHALFRRWSFPSAPGSSVPPAIEHDSLVVAPAHFSPRDPTGEATGGS